MLQAFVKKGRVLATEVPSPEVSPKGVLVKLANSCISPGTEVRSVVSSGQSMAKAVISRPEKLVRALEIAREEGLGGILDRASGRRYIGDPTGYSASGVVVRVGAEVDGFERDDRVAVSGAGTANHAEYVEAPANLVVPIPSGVDFVDAATVTLGGIAMHAVRRAQTEFGEYAIVYGTGAIGLLLLQMLVVSGARVIAVDVNKKRLAMAGKLGAELLADASEEGWEKSVYHHTGGHGADVAFFCASGVPLSGLFPLLRRKGRVVAVGIWSGEPKRKDLYDKELDFLISSSSGPGRYDPKYELQGQDYPYGYVRWTQKRNMEEYLRLLSVGKINAKCLINGVYDVEEVGNAYEALQGADPPLLLALRYGSAGRPEDSSVVKLDCRARNRSSYRRFASKRDDSKRIAVGIVGAGRFATSVHLPNLTKLSELYEIRGVCCRTGSRAMSAATQFDAQYATTNYEEILHDPSIDLVMICTPHDLHGEMVLQSLNAGKHTFVEKPLCTGMEDLERIRSFFDGDNPCETTQPKPYLMVGFNRRFSRYLREVKRHTSRRINPLSISYQFNAGYLPRNHPAVDREAGGRMGGEACHFIDCFSFLTESRVRALSAADLRGVTASVSSSDNKAVVLEYENGSVATLEYFSVGSRQAPKERLEIRFDEKTIVVNDYKSMEGFGIKVEDIRTRRPEKGQIEELRSLGKFLLSTDDPVLMDIDSIFETTEISLRLAGDSSSL